jgi:hypothetical protein
VTPGTLEMKKPSASFSRPGLARFLAIYRVLF